MDARTPSTTRKRGPRAPRLTKKVIPYNRFAWAVEFDGVLRYIKVLQTKPVSMNADWARGQLDYYKLRLGDLRTHAPKGVRIVGDGYEFTE